MKLTMYQGSEDWSALYVDGKLNYVGDHYNVEERIHELVGVEIIQSDGFLLGGNYREDAAKTVEEVEAFDRAAEEVAESASNLREEAARLLALANQLEGKSSE